MPSPVDELCSRYHYPDALRDVLNQLVDAAAEAYPEAKSFILSGSGSTGDYVYREDPHGEIELISDLDMTLFTGSGDQRPEVLEEAIDDIKLRHRSSLFQVDVEVNPLRMLESIAPSFQMVETRHAGVVLAGEDVLAHYPESFDNRASRRSFLGNLWKPVLYWTPGGSGHDVVYTQVAARLFLDVPLLAGANNGECIPGHRARAEHYLSSPSTKGLYSEALRERVRWAIEARTNPTEERAGLERSIADFAFEVTQAIDGMGPVPEDPDHALVERLADWLPKRTPRRLAGETRSVLRDPHSPTEDLRWIARNKEAMGGAAMLGILAYLASGEGDAPEAPLPSGVADRLCEYARLDSLAREDDETALDFVARIKAAYWSGLSTLYPSLGKKEAGLEVFFRPSAEKA